MSPAELEAEKLKELKLQEEAELKLVKQAFGNANASKHWKITGKRYSIWMYYWLYDLSFVFNQVLGKLIPLILSRKMILMNFVS